MHNKTIYYLLTSIPIITCNVLVNKYTHEIQLNPINPTDTNPKSYNNKDEPIKLEPTPAVVHKIQLEHQITINVTTMKENKTALPKSFPHVNSVFDKADNFDRLLYALNILTCIIIILAVQKISC